MAARAIWKGVITFGDVRVPVKLYSAVESRGVHFRLLHEPDTTPVKQRMVNPLTGEEVPYERIRRGYETDAGDFILLDDEELAELEPESSRDIHVTRFLDPAEINHQWYDRPYYLGPDDDAASYFALVEALGGESGPAREGVARWTMRKKDYLGALRVEKGHLALITLRHAGEVVPASALPRPAGRKPDRKELAMAEQLVSLLEDEFDPEAYRDEYRERVLELVEAKRKGGTIERKPAERRSEAGSLREALEQSVESARKERARVA